MPAIPRTRRRIIRTDSRPLNTASYQGPTHLSDSKLTASSTSYQYTFSEGHKVSLIGKTGANVGGPFLTQKIEHRLGGQYVSVKNGPTQASPWYWYTGDIYPTTFTKNGAVALAASTTSQMNAAGTIAISRVLPTNPLSGMGQFLGELRDLPKGFDFKSWQEKSRHFRNETRKFDFKRAPAAAANEYLNQVFGWIPFLKDLSEFNSVRSNADKHIAQYARNSGKHIRRRYNFPDDTSTVVQDLGPSWGSPTLVTYLLVSQGKRTRTTETMTKRWFSGAFTYYLPPVFIGDDGNETLFSKLRRSEAYANKLFGLRLTPDLVYKLTPWSWALDWVSTTGAVVRNWSAFSQDGLVMHHGYIMEHKSQKTTDTLTDLRLHGGVTVNCSSESFLDTKSRAPATPYGFGVNPASFSTKQWSIIAALGISNLPRSLG